VRLRTSVQYAVGPSREQAGREAAWTGVGSGALPVFVLRLPARPEKGLPWSDWDHRRRHLLRGGREPLYARRARPGHARRWKRRDAQVTLRVWTRATDRRWSARPHERRRLRMAGGGRRPPAALRRVRRRAVRDAAQRLCRRLPSANPQRPLPRGRARAATRRGWLARTARLSERGLAPTPIAAAYDSLRRWWSADAPDPV
jgi:hypothetical protein